MSPYREAGRPPGQTCPRCGGVLATISSGSIARDECSRCKGVWIVEAELVRAVDDQKARALLRESSPLVVDGRDPIRCVVCSVAMPRTGLGSGIHVDACVHGVWLDRGELEAIARACPPGGDPLAEEPGDGDDWMIEFVRRVKEEKMW